MQRMVLRGIYWLPRLEWIKNDCLALGRAMLIDYQDPLSTFKSFTAIWIGWKEGYKEKQKTTKETFQKSTLNTF